MIFELHTQFKNVKTSQVSIRSADLKLVLVFDLKNLSKRAEIIDVSTVIGKRPYGFYLKMIHIST